MVAPAVLHLCQRQAGMTQHTCKLQQADKERLAQCHGAPHVGCRASAHKEIERMMGHTVPSSSPPEHQPTAQTVCATIPSNTQYTLATGRLLRTVCQQQTRHPGRQPAWQGSNSHFTTATTNNCLSGCNLRHWQWHQYINIVHAGLRLQLMANQLPQHEAQTGSRCTLGLQQWSQQQTGSTSRHSVPRRQIAMQCGVVPVHSAHLR